MDAELPSLGQCRCIHRYDIRGQELHPGIEHLTVVPAARTAISHHVIGVDDIQIRLPEQREIGNALVEIVPMVVGTVPDQPHEVLERAGYSCRVVVLEDGYVDELIGLGHQLVNFRFLETPPRRERRPCRIRCWIGYQPSFLRHLPQPVGFPSPGKHWR